MPKSELPLCVQIAKFLPQDVRDIAYDYSIANEAGFQPTTVDTDAADHRSSLVLHEFSPVRKIFLEHLRKRAPAIIRRLGGGELGAIECQLTAHNDGDYYRMHNDNGSPVAAHRAFTFVYYFSRMGAFTGGDLKLHRNRIERGKHVADERFQLIAPTDNSIVFFAAHHMHEVLAVHCPSHQFADSRFTINGWIGKK